MGGLLNLQINELTSLNLEQLMLVNCNWELSYVFEGNLNLISLKQSEFLRRIERGGSVDNR